MERCDVMAWTEPHGSPDNRDSLSGRTDRTNLQMGEILQLECDVMHLDIIASDKIYCMMICVAAQKHEEIVDPVRNTEAQYLLVEFGDLALALDYEGDVPNFSGPTPK